MSTIFKFLKDYDKYAYKWATNMERTLYKEPLGALAYGGRFLESIRTALYQIHYKEMAKYNRNLSKSSDELKINSLSFKQEDLKKHIADLYHAKQIKSIDSYRINSAYNIRHRLHENEDIDDIESDKDAALELYRKVFEISIWFCKHKDPSFNDEGIIFSYPSEEEYDDEIPDVDIVKIFNDCVICGQENISPNRNICPECYRKIRLASDLDDLMDLLNNENRFTKDFLKMHSYDRYEIDYTIHFLKQYELISRESKDEIFINKNKAYNFIEEMMSYEEVEKILIAFYNELIEYEDIDKTFYELGENGDKYYQFYLLVITKKIKHFLNLKSKNHPNALEESGVSIREISNWYTRKVKKTVLSNYKRDLDISFNQMSRLLMDKWVEYREKGEKKEEIKEKLLLNVTVLDFWFDDSLRRNNKYPYIREFIPKNREIEMRLFVEGLLSGLNKDDAIAYADTDEEFVNKNFNLSDEEALIRRWRIGKQTNNELNFNRYKNIYFRNKTQEFLDELKSSDIDSALLSSDLSEEEFNKWYGWGKREFFKYNCNTDDVLFKFYIKTTQTLMDKWLDERKDGHKKLESCKNIGLYSDTLKEWFRFEKEDIKDFDTNPKYKTFREFYRKNRKMEMNLVIESIENGDTAIRAAKIADISKEELDEYYKLGKEGEEEYIDFYKKYEEIYLPLRRKEFISLFKKKEDYNKAIKVSELSPEEIETAYESGRDGNEEYKDFYEDLLDAKLKTYSGLLSSREKEKKALKKSDLTKEEKEEYSYRIEILMLLNNMLGVLHESIKGKKLEKTVSKLTISMNDIFDWYLKGKELFETSDIEYLDFDEIFETEENTFFEYLIKDKDYKTNSEKDLDTYYMHFYNLYHETHVKKRAETLSKAISHDKKSIKSALRFFKVSKKEFEFYDSLGLIDRNMTLDDEEPINEEKLNYSIRRE